MKSILPIIFIVLVLTGAITYSLAKRAVPEKPTESIGISANQLENESTLTPTPTTTTKLTFDNLAVTPSVTPIVTPTALPAVTEKNAVITTTKITKTTICTPVYGSADTCTEHVVVDTGAESSMFFNFAGLAYIGGLLSFVKAKSLKK